jgi:hypothetical protein
MRTRLGRFFLDAYQLSARRPSLFRRPKTWTISDLYKAATPHKRIEVAAREAFGLARP